MTLNISNQPNAIVAIKRYGLGPKPGAVDRIGSDVVGALQRELDNPGWAAISDSTLPSYADACAKAADVSVAEAHARVELRARINKALKPEIGLLERLVQFWSNYFSVCITRANVCAATIGQLERDVIRKHVLGNFTDMLVGVYKHPAMIAYLDNDFSVGPNSPYGVTRLFSLNENLAREMLELHTVGKYSNYKQSDIVAAAKILTGWSYVRSSEARNGTNGGSMANLGQFIYRDSWHEPGTHTVLGRSFSRTGIDQGLDMLRFLGQHSRTGENIAFRMLRHFKANTPSASDIAVLRNAFVNSGGDLKAVTEAMLSLPDAFESSPKKFVPPYDMLMSYFRAMGVQSLTTANELQFLEPLRNLYQMTWVCPSPSGYSDLSRDWASTDAMVTRSKITYAVVKQIADIDDIEPAERAMSLLKTFIRRSTYEAVAANTWPRNGLSILLMSPEYQTR